jgi:hypothetical protein
VYTQKRKKYIHRRYETPREKTREVHSWLKKGEDGKYSSSPDHALGRKRKMVKE